MVSGNVGIGTATPGKKLTVAGDMEIGTTSSDYHHLRVGGGNSSGYLYGSYAALSDGIHLGYNYYYDAAGTGHQVMAGGGNSRLTVGYGWIGLATGNSNSAPVNRMYVGQSGAVGIGTSSPQSMFHVRGGAMLDLRGNGGGNLVVTNNANDNSIYLEGYSSNHTSSASAMHIAGRLGNALPILNLSATNVQVRGGSPVVIRSYPCSDIAYNDNLAHTFSTGFATNAYSAVVAGLQFDGDIDENVINHPLLKVRMIRLSGQNDWMINYGMSHEGTPLSNIVVDVMFIRRELTDDNR